LRRAFSGRWGRLAPACVLALCTGVACSRFAPAADRAKNDPPALFAQACAKCHATDGSGGLPTVVDGPRPTDLTAQEWQRARSDAEVIAAIRTGRGAMPPFEGVLTTEQIDALGAYIRTLKRP
jgi:cytochrome c6